MARERQEQLQPEEINTLLSLLEAQGRNKWFERWKIHIALPAFLNPLADDWGKREIVLRYLLLRVLINQQAKAEKVRELCLQLAEEFGELLFYKPFNVSEKTLFSLFKKCGGEKGSQIYRVGALGGIKPLSLFAYRFKAYEGFIRWLDEEHKSFFEVINFYILQAKNPKNLVEQVYWGRFFMRMKDPILSGQARCVQQ